VNFTRSRENAKKIGVHAEPKGWWVPEKFRANLARYALALLRLPVFHLA
jgi:hypothetical protein